MSANKIVHKDQRVAPVHPKVERSHPVIVGIRFIGNTVKEAIAHPLSVSVIDKSTGKVVRRNDKVVT